MLLNLCRSKLLQFVDLLNISGFYFADTGSFVLMESYYTVQIAKYHCILK